MTSASPEPTDRRASELAPVEVRREGAVATIAFNRPEAMNSLDAATRRALLTALEEVGADPEVRAVVLTGSGRSFSAGHDLLEHLAALAPDRDGARQPMEEVWAVVPQEYNPLAEAVAGLDKPVIAAVNGVAAGAGASLAFLADLRILSASAGFNLAFAGIALSCDTGSSWSLPRLVGPTRALELLFHPRTISAEESREYGLATEVVPDEEFTAHVSAVAAKLAAGPTLAFAAIRQSVAHAASRSLSESLQFEAQQMARTGASDDHLAAVDAFVAKERPHFTGR